MKSERIKWFVIGFVLACGLWGYSSQSQALGQTEEGILYGLGIYKVWEYHQRGTRLDTRPDLW